MDHYRANNPYIIQPLIYICILSSIHSAFLLNILNILRINHLTILFVSLNLYLYLILKYSFVEYEPLSFIMVRNIPLLGREYRVAQETFLPTFCADGKDVR